MLNEINKRGPTGIKTFISGGDELKGEYVSKLMKEGVVYNTYGPTETTVCTAYYKCRGSEPSNIPIGKPIKGYSVYIMAGDTRRLVPVGIPGELCIGGEGVTRGYLNRPELTAEKFLFISYKSYRTYRTYSSKKIYRTGDLGRWLADGNIEFLGRIDRQVKIRGYRIEPGEIENRLLARPGVKAAVVMAGSAGDGRGKYICAYVVIHSLSTDHSSDISQLREHLARELPGYMIPSYFIKLDSIPLTPSGKVDRNALPVPENTRSYLKTTYVQPETETEKIVAGIWKELLGVDKVGLDDNFFELGGNSLNIVQLTGKLKKILGRDIPIVTMFRFPKISSFLEYLNGMGESEGKKEVKIGVSGKERSEVVARGKNMMRRSIQKRRTQ
jgi:acyl carrier protein